MIQDPLEITGPSSQAGYTLSTALDAVAYSTVLRFGLRAMGCYLYSKFSGKQAKLEKVLNVVEAV